MTNIQYIIREGDRSFTPCPFGMTHGTISFKDNWLIPAVIKSLRRRKKSIVCVGSWVCQSCVHFVRYEQKQKKPFSIMCSIRPNDKQSEIIFT